jgi:hypothetical protein
MKLWASFQSDKAIDAALSIRLAVAPGIDVQFGVGWGSVMVLDAGAAIQDGPGWWAAREAIEWPAAEQISASAVSPRAGRDGVDLIVQASEYLRSVP